MAESAAGSLNHYILHSSIRNLAHVVGKMNDYTTQQVETMKEPHPFSLFLRLLIEFPFSFFKAYVIRKHTLRGTYGFVLAMTFAFSRFLRLAKLYERSLNKKSQ